MWFILVKEKSEAFTKFKRFRLWSNKRHELPSQSFELDNSCLKNFSYTVTTTASSDT